MRAAPTILGANLDLLVARHFASVSEACRQIGINRTQFNRYRNDGAWPDGKVLPRILEGLKCDARILHMPLEEIDALRPYDPRLRGAVDLLLDVSPDARLLQLKNLALNNNGIWPIADRVETSGPCYFEITLLGVTATATSIDDLPHIWLTAASNVLNVKVAA